jgi:Fur family ferric uptake transcriptional regulator
VPPARVAPRRDEEIYDAIRHRGGRVTSPTRTVVSVLLETERHLTADDLIDEVGRRTTGVAPSTVYRVLQRLSELGIVEHVHAGDGPAFYHLREHGHAHLVCHRCGVVTDIEDGALAALARRVDEAHGFALDTHHAALLGLCAACRSQ